MALTIGDNFNYQGAKPLDGRIKYNTLAAMKAMADSTLYDGCLAYCVATEKNYQWKSTNTVDETLGKWRELEIGSSGHIIENASGTDMTERMNLQFKGLDVSDDSTNDRTVVDGSKMYRTDDTAETTLDDADSFPFYDNSAGAKRRTLWSTIKSKLGDVFQAKLSNATYLAKIGEQGGNPTYNNVLMSLPGISHFDKSNLYSTTEKVVGCWSDGRPLYQKTVSCGDFQSQTTRTVAHGISNLDKVIQIFWCGKANNGISICDNYASLVMAQSDDYVQKGNSFTVYVHDSNIGLMVTGKSVASNDLLKNVYVTLQYTKTTDAANSFNYASENDYSTSETVVGTWIGGQTLYQRTFEFNTGSSADKTITTLASNVRVVDIKGVASFGTSGKDLAPFNFVDNSTNVLVYLENLTLKTYISNSDWFNKQAYITIQYYKV